MISEAIIIIILAHINPLLSLRPLLYHGVTTSLIHCFPASITISSERRLHGHYEP